MKVRDFIPPKMWVLVDGEQSTKDGIFQYYSHCAKGRIHLTENLADAEIFKTRADVMRSEAYQSDRAMYPLKF